MLRASCAGSLTGIVKALIYAMTDPYVQKVIALANVSRAFEQPTSRDWQAVEKELAIALPEDFKQLVSELGTGEFGEFGLHNPVSTSEHARLSLGLLMQFRDWHERDGIDMYPDPGGYVWVGHLPNGMDMLVSPGPKSASAYRLGWFEVDRRRLYDIPMTICRFLHDMYFGLFQADWSEYVRGLIWEPGEDFFAARPGVRGDAYA
jgi:hypothetical protein